MTGLLLFKNLLFTVLVPGTVGVYVPLVIARATDGHARGGLTWLLGLALLAAGALIYMICVLAFAGRGRGTPAPIDPPRRLVVTGLYRFVRNPMYIGVLSVILGWASLTRSSWLLAYALLVALGFHAFITLYEEPALRRRFGADYERYCVAVRRWRPGRPWSEAPGPSH